MTRYEVATTTTRETFEDEIVAAIAKDVIMNAETLNDIGAAVLNLSRSNRRYIREYYGTNTADALDCFNFDICSIVEMYL